MKKVILLSAALIGFLSVVFAQQNKQTNYLEISSGISYALGDFDKLASNGVNLDISYKYLTTEHFGLFHSFKVQSSEPNTENMLNAAQSGLGSSGIVNSVYADNFKCLGVTSGMIGNIKLSKESVLQPKVGFALLSCNSPLVIIEATETTNFTDIKLTQYDSKALKLGFVTGIAYIYTMNHLYGSIGIEYLSVSPTYKDVETTIETAVDYDISYSDIKIKNKYLSTQFAIGINF